MSSTAGILLAVLLAAACESAPRPRHVLVVTLDTMRADRLPAYGFRGVATPALDRLAAESALFEQAFAPVPLTLPSHATLFTGLLPPRHGVRDNAAMPLPASVETLAEILQARGFATAAFLASSVLAPGQGLEQGFDTYSLGRSDCGGTPRARRDAREVMDEALRWLEQGGRGPFFAWIHLYDTHQPYRLPAEHARGYADPYAAAIAFEDAQIGRLLDHLESRELIDETLVVILGDHGESLGDHGEDTHGIFVYQETLRVPLIVRGPGVPSRRIGAAVRLTDIMPTVLEMLDADAVPTDGMSLTGLMKGAVERAPREVYAESLYPQRFGWASLKSVRAGRYKLIDAPRPELFDLETDPSERHNLVRARPAVASALRGRLREIDERAAPANRVRALDAAAVERLASLGYVAGTSDVSTDGRSLPDPKDTIATFNRITSQQALMAVRRFGAARCAPSGGE